MSNVGCVFATELNLNYVIIVSKSIFYETCFVMRVFKSLKQLQNSRKQKKKTNKILIQTQYTNFSCKLDKAARKSKKLSMLFKTLVFNIFQNIAEFFSRSNVHFTCMCTFVK